MRSLRSPACEDAVHRPAQTKDASLHIILLAAFATLLVRTAWVCDDAYITLRTLDNFVNGHGLRWNIGERVQSYSHPLWMMALGVFYCLTREAYYTSLALGAVCSVAAGAVLIRGVARGGVWGPVAFALLLGCRAFVEYSTSGLENPLSHLLLISFAACYLHAPAPFSPRRLLCCSLLAALGCLNRLDHSLIYFPCMLWLLVRHFEKRAVLALATGFVPVFAWEVFSVIYYGVPFPNTAYAKIVTDAVPAADLRRQGLMYFLHSLKQDPLTLMLISAALCLAFAGRRLRPAALAAGMLLYMAYILKIGGDFMSGRFFTILAAAAAVIVAAQSRPPRPLVALAPLALGLLVAWSGPYPPFRSRSDFKGEGIGADGIADERSHYYQGSGLLRARPDFTDNLHGMAKTGKELQKAHPDGHTMTATAVGYLGYFAGPRIHIMDLYALCDPLLARMPVPKHRRIRPGHIQRYVPDGYFETLESGVNRIRDRELAAFYEQLHLITSGPLFSPARLRAVWKLNTGGLNELFRHYDPVDSCNRYPLHLANISRPVPDQKWNDWRAFVTDQIGIPVELDGVHHKQNLEISLDTNDVYELIFFREGRELKRVKIMPDYRPSLAVYRLVIPGDLAQAGYDRIRVRALKGDRNMIMGYLRLD